MEEIGDFKWIVGYCIDSPTKVFNELSRLVTPCSTCFNCDRYKYIKSLYLIVLLTAALSAAAPAEFAIAWICDALYVFGTVTSHAKGLPRDQGSSVAPSGLLPSILNNQIGSLLGGICVFFTTLHMRSLSDECRI